MQIATPSFIVTASGCAPPMPPSPAVSVMVPASVPVPSPLTAPRRELLGDGGERLERALQDALGADVDPRAGGHLPVHRQPEVLEPPELLPVRPVADEVGVRDQHPRRPLVGAHHADRLAALDEQRLVALEGAQGAHDRVVRLPRARGLARAAVHHEGVGVLGVVRVEVVHQHPQRRLGLPALRAQLGAARRADLTWSGHDISPIVASTARTKCATSYVGEGVLDLGGEVPVRSRALDVATQQGDCGTGGRRGLQRRPQVDGARRGEVLHRDHPRQPVDRSAQLASRGPAHRHVVLLHRRRGDRVDAGRGGQPLHLGDDRGLRVLRDHVPGVDAGVGGEERRQAVAAGLVEEPVGAALGDRCDVGGDDREEVEHVGHRGAVEVAVGLDATVLGKHHRVVDGRGELSRGDQRGVVDGVPGGAVHLRRAAQRVGVLHAVAVRPAVARDDAGVREQPRQVGRGGRLSRVRAQRLQVGGEDPVGRELRLDAHRGRDVGGLEKHPQVGDREDEHAEHPVGAVDERQPLLGLQLDRRQAGLAQRDGGGTPYAVRRR